MKIEKNILENNFLMFLLGFEISGKICDYPPGTKNNLKICYILYLKIFYNLHLETRKMKHKLLFFRLSKDLNKQ